MNYQPRSDVLTGEVQHLVGRRLCENVSRPASVSLRKSRNEVKTAADLDQVTTVLHSWRNTLLPVGFG